VPTNQASSLSDGTFKREILIQFHLVFPCIIVPESWSAKDKSVALALAQASGHPLSRALTNALTGVLPLDIYDLEEIQCEGMQAKLNGEQVKVGRGSWLDANFSGFGLKIGKNPSRKVETSEELRNGVSSMIDEIDMPAEIITGDTYHAVKRFNIW
jgi:P-type Cu2+ transporter